MSAVLAGLPLARAPFSFCLRIHELLLTLQDAMQASLPAGPLGTPAHILQVLLHTSLYPGTLLPLPAPPCIARDLMNRCPGLGRDLLEEPGDILAAAAGPGKRSGVVQELWRHDERPFPNRLAVIAASIMLNAKTV